MFHAEQVSDRRVILYQVDSIRHTRTAPLFALLRQRTTLLRGSTGLKGYFIQAVARKTPKISAIINYIVFIRLCVILYIVDNKYPVT